MNWADIKHFKPEEFDDRFGKNKGLDMDDEAIHRLDSLRDWVKCPIQITAGYDSEGHSPLSWHYKGHAVDIIICTELSMRDQWQYIKLAGFNGIGIYPHWRYKLFQGGWHLDTRDTPQLWRQMDDKSYNYFLP